MVSKRRQSPQTFEVSLKTICKFQRTMQSSGITDFLKQDLAIRERCPEILRGHEQKDREKTLRWLREGVRKEDFLRGNSKGKFKGQQYDSQYPDERSFENLVEYKHRTWVGEEISRLVTYGAVKTWESCGIEGFPKIIAPLQLEEEKPRTG